MDGEVAGQAGNDHPVNIPMGVFPTSDKPINIAASSPKLWEVFCRAAGSRNGSRCRSGRRRRGAARTAHA